MTAQQTARLKYVKNGLKRMLESKSSTKLIPDRQIAETKLLKSVREPYIGFVDSDDWIEESMYEVLMNDLKTTNSRHCYL